jgi:hypothetical protein
VKRAALEGSVVGRLIQGGANPAGGVQEAAA